MRVALVNLRWEGPTHDAEIARNTLLRELASRLVQRGHDVRIVQEHPNAGRREADGVEWSFVPPGALARVGRAALGGRNDVTVKAPAPHVLGPLRDFQPDVIHSFDFVAFATVALLGRLAKSMRAALVVHDHGGAPARVAPWRAIERHALESIDRALFATTTRASMWPRLADRTSIVMESSSIFVPGDRDKASAHFGVEGHPLCLHVGRLDPVKDPLTTVEGFRQFHRTHPGARLVLAWRDAPMLEAVRRAAEGLPVTFLGALPHAEMQALYRCADLFVQSSVREVCGYAVLEAIATGLPSVLSDIEPFRRLTDDGQIGRHFAVGDAAGLASAMTDAWDSIQSGALTRNSVRASFDARLSFDQLTDQVLVAYDAALKTRRARR